jgi:predicted aldo/keto reductase-like oxidoreductase
MATISRRDFLTQTSAAAGVALLGGRRAFSADAKPKLTSGTDEVTLGHTGIKSSLMGMGTGTHGSGRSSNQLRQGTAKFIELIRHGIDRGIRYIDAADQYGSHVVLREALQGADREKLFIQTKTRAMHPEVAKVDLNRFRQELGIDYIDSLLMHCMNKASWTTDMRPVMDVLFEAKEKGWVRSVGISCHTLDALSQSADCDWLDIQLVRINPFGSAMDGPVEDVVRQIERLHAAGKGVIGMKICGGGKNTTADERAESIKYVLELGCVDSIVIGCESPQQIDENLALIERVLA